MKPSQGADLSPDDLDGDLRVDDEAVVPHVAHPDEEAEPPVALADDRLLAEHHRTGPGLRIERLRWFW